MSANRHPAERTNITEREFNMARIIGIRHRWKDLDGKTVLFKLKTEEDELDFLLGKFPTGWRELGDGEVTDGIFPRHIIVEEKKGKPTGRTLVPESYDGLQPGDTCLMGLGGSGDRL